MLEMKVNDLTECQRMKDIDGVWAAIYSHIYHKSHKAMDKQESRKKAGRLRQEMDRTISLAEIMSNKHGAVYSGNHNAQFICLCGRPTISEKWDEKRTWHTLDRRTRQTSIKQRFTLTDLKVHCKCGYDVRA